MTPEPVMLHSTGDVSVALHHLGGTGPVVLFCHATGFHGRTWDPVANALASRFDCWAIDFRGHGDTTRPDDGSLAWSGMADDVLACIDYLDTRPMFAVGHSMGGTAITLAELERPGTFSRIYLFEPILFPTIDDGTRKESGLAEGARRRREVFESRDAAYDRYASRPPLSDFDPRALRSYVDHGFRSVTEGVRLKCPGSVEAAVFDNSRNGAYERLGEVATIVNITIGGELEGAALLAANAVDRFPHAALHTIPDVTHFGPMEKPDDIAERIAAHLLPDAPPTAES